MTEYRVGKGQYFRLHELLADGFEFIPVSGGRANIIAALQKGHDVYFCYLADKEVWQRKRQMELLRYIDEGGERSEIPNIPLLCIKVE